MPTNLKKHGITWIAFAYGCLNGCEHKKHWKMANYVNHTPGKTQEIIITFSTKGDYRVSEKSVIKFFSDFNNLLFTKSQKFAPH